MLAAGPQLHGRRGLLCRRPTLTVVQDLDITPKMAAVLKVFLEDPGLPRYGFELIARTSMASGSLYPMLAKFERAGWLVRTKEDIDPRAAGRPARVNYTMPGEAAVEVRVRLTELSDRYRPPGPGLPEP